jgi:hypothetical protein
MAGGRVGAASEIRRKIGGDSGRMKAEYRAPFHVCVAASTFSPSAVRRKAAFLLNKFHNHSRDISHDERPVAN